MTQAMSEITVEWTHHDFPEEARTFETDNPNEALGCIQGVLERDYETLDAVTFPEDEEAE